MRNLLDDNLIETIDLYIIGGEDDFLELLKVIVRNGVDIRAGIEYLNSLGRVVKNVNGSTYVTFKEEGVENA